MVLQGQSGREDLGVGDLTKRCDGPLPVDLVLGEATEHLDREILVEEIAERQRRARSLAARALIEVNGRRLIEASLGTVV
jgi:hypothetical protein